MFYWYYKVELSVSTGQLVDTNTICEIGDYN